MLRGKRKATVTHLGSFSLKMNPNEVLALGVILLIASGILIVVSPINLGKVFETSVNSSFKTLTSTDDLLIQNPYIGFALFGLFMLVYASYGRLKETKVKK